jgi:HD superfamily phosphodiesterase
MKDIIDEARNFAMEMADTYEIPPFPHTELVVKKGEDLARRLNADEKIVVVSCYLMDIALGKAVKEGRQQEHVKMGVDMTAEFLAKFDFSAEDKGKILNSIAAHHGQIDHNCIESEIVKNADNYRFLDPTGAMLSLFYHLKDRTFKQAIDILKEKLEEKYKLVTLDICKKEADENYKIIKNFLDKVMTE